MKCIKILLISLAVLSFISCRQKNNGKKDKTSMETDSLYSSDKNVTIVNEKDTIRLIESMKNFEDNPDIMNADMDAGKNISSPEIQYVLPNDTIRLGEPGGKKK